MTPQQINTVSECIINGMSQREIAPLVGVSQPTICRNLQQSGAQEQIAKIKAQLLDQAAQQSADNIIFAVQGYREGIRGDDGKIDTQLRDHGYKASTLILQSTGLLQSHTAPTLIQINNNIELSPQLERIMRIADQVGAVPEDAGELIDL